MFTFQTLIDSLRARPRKIVFTEGSDPRILEAAARLLSGTFLTPILMGNEIEILTAAQRAGYNIRGATIIDPKEYRDMDMMVDKMAELRKGKMTREQCAEALTHRNYFGTMLVATGQADALLGDRLYAHGSV